ncbi:cyclophilin-like protein [Choiromyces venosus 120613-1]|uniref:peptidylprolyl isomerase n=1 Tax=Choiromyces venosus 120613-1 TaxID=1336337 RepID=A0A3N4J4R4_9PEZI|nr:cyclophilin-like protein [Choiromyces venosus 120613-1]
MDPFHQQMEPPRENAPTPCRKRTFFIIQVNDMKIGMMTFEMYNEKTPITCENFRLLCTGSAGNVTQRDGTITKLHYCGTRIHRIIDGLLIQGGDITKGDGTGGASIFADGTEAFGEDGFSLENIGWRSISAPGLLCMANRGGNKSNTSQFFITLSAANFLTPHHTVFGHIIDGMELLQEIGKIPVVENEYPSVKVEIVKSGEITMNHLMVLSPQVPIRSTTSPNRGLKQPQSVKTANSNHGVPPPPPGHKRTHSKQATVMEIQMEAARVAAGRGDMDENRDTKRRVVIPEEGDCDEDIDIGGPSTQLFGRKYHGLCPHCSHHRTPLSGMHQRLRPRGLLLTGRHGGGYLYPANYNERESTSNEKEDREVFRYHRHHTNYYGNGHHDWYEERGFSEKSYHCCLSRRFA